MISTAAVWILFVMHSIYSSPLICRDDACPRFETAEKKVRGAEMKNDDTHVKKIPGTSTKFRFLTSRSSKTNHPITVFLIFSRTEVEHPPILEKPIVGTLIAQVSLQ
jgi:hypothetical protein